MSHFLILRGRQRLSSHVLPLPIGAGTESEPHARMLSSQPAPGGAPLWMKMTGRAARRQFLRAIFTAGSGRLTSRLSHLTPACWPPNCDALDERKGRHLKRPPLIGATRRTDFVRNSAIAARTSNDGFPPSCALRGRAPRSPLYVDSSGVRKQRPVIVGFANGSYRALCCRSRYGKRAPGPTVRPSIVSVPRAQESPHFDFRQ